MALCLEDIQRSRRTASGRWPSGPVWRVSSVIATNRARHVWLDFESYRIGREDNLTVSAGRFVVGVVREEDVVRVAAGAARLSGFAVI